MKSKITEMPERKVYKCEIVGLVTEVLTPNSDTNVKIGDKILVRVRINSGDESKYLDMRSKYALDSNLCDIINYKIVTFKKFPNDKNWSYKSIFGVPYDKIYDIGFKFNNRTDIYEVHKVNDPEEQIKVPEVKVDKPKNKLLGIVGKVIYVKWISKLPKHHEEWTVNSDTKEFIEYVESYGKVVSECTDFITLASSFNGDFISGYINIPKGIIAEIIELNQIKKIEL